MASWFTACCRSVCTVGKGVTAVRVRVLRFASVLFSALSAGWVCAQPAGSLHPDLDGLLARPYFGNEPISPIPVDSETDPGRVALGDRLFHDPILSHDQRLSCADCHDLDQYGSSGKIHTVGKATEPRSLKPLTVFNTGLNFALCWDGRAPTLEEQIDRSVNSHRVFGSSWREVLARLKADKSYRLEFSRQYSDGLTQANVKDAIATFERSLTTPNSPFDRYLRGDRQAIDQDQLVGYRLFKSYGCSTCHQGANVGGNMFQHMGTLGSYFGGRRPVTRSDLGRYNVTGREEDRHLFKVPSLRLAAKNPPYLHDGSTDSLDQAIEMMVQYQLGRTISEEDVRLINRFLHSLVGDHPRFKP